MRHPRITPDGLATRTVDSPLGVLRLRASEDGVREIAFGAKPGERSEGTPASERHLEQLAAELGEYFNGGRRSFDVPLDPVGTDFQRRVWSALTEIPFGQTCSYRDLAKAIGNPAAIRAVGGANGANPIAIVVPCHRVIGANGTLVGYGGELWRKERLLRLEGIATEGALFTPSEGDRAPCDAAVPSSSRC